ncbi:MAG TPA: aminoglycoside phosphotransferase family protein [Vicinamibacterales bacterium]|nr:aminoglycoside phosphotransferase family protein [Vicinamibacterales bacterium]
MESRATAFVMQYAPLPPGVELDVKPIHGGLESTVARATVKGNVPHAPGLPRRFVVKELRGAQRREADVYELLWRRLEHPPAARLLGHTETDDASYLYLEDVRRLSAWPWRDHQASAAVCRALARVHDAPDIAAALPPWDYEAELARSADETLRVALMVRHGAAPVWRRLGDLRRVVTGLVEMRRRLLSGGATLIHGDVHPGNVIVRSGGGPYRIVLIDWARARLGSPLEDVASWLHSLGCWDVEARRRHDSLLAVYLQARHPPIRFDAAVRANYWLASASNGLSGAIRYHLVMLGNPAVTGKARADSQRALDEWQRVIRGAAAALATPRAC